MLIIRKIPELLEGMVSRMKDEVFYSATDNLEDIPDTFYDSYEDVLEVAVRNHLRFILKTIQHYEVVTELEHLSNQTQ